MAGEEEQTDVSKSGEQNTPTDPLESVLTKLATAAGPDEPVETQFTSEQIGQMSVEEYYEYLFNLLDVPDSSEKGLPEEAVKEVAAKIDTIAIRFAKDIESVSEFQKNHTQEEAEEYAMTVMEVSEMSSFLIENMAYFPSISIPPETLRMSSTRFFRQYVSF